MFDLCCAIIQKSQLLSFLGQNHSACSNVHATEFPQELACIDLNLMNLKLQFNSFPMVYKNCTHYSKPCPSIKLFLSRNAITDKMPQVVPIALWSQ